MFISQGDSVKKQKGFSLIELLIVVAIILIIAAIAIPNLLKARMSANESSAAGSMRTYNTAMVAYATQCPTNGFPAAVANIAPGVGNCTAANLVDQVLGGQTVPALVKSGYIFAYVAGAPNNGIIGSYTINADPVTCGSTGIKTFFTNETAVITGPLTNTSAAGGCVAAKVTDGPIQ